MQIEKLIWQLKQKWAGKDYDLLGKNCNHFCEEFAEKLGVSGIPGMLTEQAVTHCFARQTPS